MPPVLASPASLSPDSSHDTAHINPPAWTFGPPERSP
jgi:hypothetical protein